LYTNCSLIDVPCFERDFTLERAAAGGRESEGVAGMSLAWRSDRTKRGLSLFSAAFPITIGGYRRIGRGALSAASDPMAMAEMR
jgi:hypothetical protein